jgi:hypothetical protein
MTTMLEKRTFCSKIKTVFMDFPWLMARINFCIAIKIKAQFPAAGYFEAGLNIY